MPKKKLTLSIDEEIITQAKKLEINLSSFLEIRLVDYLNYKVCFRREENPNLPVLFRLIDNNYFYKSL